MFLFYLPFFFVVLLKSTGAAVALAHAAETLGFEFECRNYFFFFARTRLGDEHKMIFFLFQDNLPYELTPETIFEQLKNPFT